MENHEMSATQAGGLEFEGIWNIQLFDSETGEQVLDHTQKNIVVDNAIITMCEGKGPADFTMLQLGNAPFPTTPNVSDLALNSLFFTGSTVHSNTSGHGTFSYQKKCSLQTTDAVGVITEAALALPNGTIFNRVLFNPSVSKTSTQTGFVNTTIIIRRV